MPVGEALDDDYVIGLLKKDADANQKRYLSNGLGSLLSKRPRGNAPKPNTRFLKNIIRETDNHNAALKAKEEEESKVRLRELRGEKRKRDEKVDDTSSKRKRGEEKQGRWASVLGGLGQAAVRRDDRRRDPNEKEEELRSNRYDRRKHERGDEKDGQYRRQRRKERHTGSARARSRSPLNRKERRRNSTRRSTSPAGPFTKSEPGNGNNAPLDESDSDPLEDFLGPTPAPKSLPRGRGAFKPSDMDARFDPSYNPKTDVNLEPEEERDDWDMALEALRDRAKWRTQGADRLRAAGFTEDEVKKWEKGGEKGAEDVRWRKKGEGREWDRGKVIDEDGQVDVKAEWGRLKGT